MAEDSETTGEPGSSPPEGNSGKRSISIKSVVIVIGVWTFGFGIGLFTWSWITLTKFEAQIEAAPESTVSGQSLQQDNDKETIARLRESLREERTRYFQKSLEALKKQRKLEERLAAVERPLGGLPEEKVQMQSEQLARKEKEIVGSPKGLVRRRAEEGEARPQAKVVDKPSGGGFGLLGRIGREPSSVGPAIESEGSEIETRRRAEIEAGIENERIVPVFFATNRKSNFDVFRRNDPKYGEFIYGKRYLLIPEFAERDITGVFGAQEGDLNYGRINVSLPKDHREGHLESPSYWRLEFSFPDFKLKPDPKEHVTLASLEILKEDDFFKKLKGTVNQSPKREALVFIHGYNVGFVDAVRRTGQIAYDLRFPGAPILFSWPSKGKTALYTHDKDAALGAAPVLREFLIKVAERSGATSVHVIAHSMGNVPLIQALHDMAISRPPDALPIFSEIILAAPDVRASRFRKLAKEFTKASKRVTLYASKTDKVLKASIAANGFRRAGDTTNEVVIVDKIDTIDASNLDTDFLGHSYISSDRTVINDLFHVLINHLAPIKRKLDPKLWNDQRYWAFSR